MCVTCIRDNATFLFKPNKPTIGPPLRLAVGPSVSSLCCVLDCGDDPDTRRIDGACGGFCERYCIDGLLRLRTDVATW